jgi:hypothetical protein
MQQLNLSSRLQYLLVLFFFNPSFMFKALLMSQADLQLCILLSAHLGFFHLHSACSDTRVVLFS